MIEKYDQLIMISCFFLLLTSCSKFVETNHPEHQMVGKSFNTVLPMVYVYNLNPQTMGSISTENINNALVSIEDARALYPSHFRDSIKHLRYINSKENFTVVKVFTVVPKGTQKAFSSRYDMAVVHDNSGIESTIPLTLIEHYSTSPTLLQPHIIKLFNEVQAFGNVNISVTLRIVGKLPQNPQDRKEVIVLGQEIFRQKLPKYIKIENVKLDQAWPRITLTVDATSLAYLISSVYELEIVEITQIHFLS